MITTITSRCETTKTTMRRRTELTTANGVTKTRIRICTTKSRTV